MSDGLVPADIRFSVNNSQRLPLALVIDTSHSMHDKISALNEGLKALEVDLKEDAMARNRVEILVVRCGPDVQVISDWRDAAEFHAPVCEANGGTPLAEAVNLALDRIRMEKEDIDHNGLSRNRAWLMIISDGDENKEGEWTAAAERARREMTDKEVVVFPIAVGDANIEKLARFSTAGCKRLKGLAFRELFVWLSQSARSTSRKAPGDRTQLAEMDSWTEIEA